MARLNRTYKLVIQVIMLSIVSASCDRAGNSQIAAPSSGQMDGSGQQQPRSNRNDPLGAELDSQQPPLRDTAKQRMNAERQRKLVSDTERLLVLAHQLKVEAAAAGTESWTPEMLHQMEEIQKLARSVKDKMRS